MFQFPATHRTGSGAVELDKGSVDMELQEISDKLEIADLLTEYTRAVDTGDFDRFDNVFTPDAHLDYASSGGTTGDLEHVKAWMPENVGLFGRRMHVIAQIETVFDGPDTAHVTAYFLNPMSLDLPDDKVHQVDLAGLYHHQLVRTPDGWRSRDLVCELLFKQGL